jgi:hypothetical protein
MKVDEWNLKKNIPAKDMGILVAKAKKRERDQGKETVFFHGDSQVAPDRFQHFKRRKTTVMIDTASPTAGRLKYE